MQSQCWAIRNVNYRLSSLPERDETSPPSPSPSLPIPLPPLSELAPHSTIWTSGTGRLSTATKSDEMWLYSQLRLMQNKKLFAVRILNISCDSSVTLETQNLAHVMTIIIIIIFILARGNSSCWGLELFLCSWPYTVNRMVRCSRYRINSALASPYQRQ